MGYTGPGSPRTGPPLSPDRAACANGKQQSPIDITGYRVSDLGPISFSLATIEAILLNDCRQIHVDYAPGNTSVLGGREYSLKSAHLHSPSEHLVDGHSFAAELHMVHADSGGNLAVVGLLFTLGAPSSVVQSILDAPPPPTGATANTKIPLPTSLPADLSYFRYDGSKTTPTCDEPVDWHVLRQPATMSQEIGRWLAVTEPAAPTTNPPRPEASAS